MSSINVKKIKELAQKKINALTDSSSLTDLENLMKISMLSGGGHLSVDSDGSLPSSGRLAFDNQYDRLFLNKKAPNYTGTNWEPLQAGKTSTIAPDAVARTFMQGLATGFQVGGLTAYPSTKTTVINSWSFSSDGNATDHGDILAGQDYMAGSTSETHGYQSGGQDPTGTGKTNVIQKFSMASADNASDVGDLLSTVGGAAGHSSDVSGYVSGGSVPPNSNVIQKFPFSADTNSTDVGDLSAAQGSVYGHSSSTHGYNFNDPFISFTADKFPFASDTNATNVTPTLTRSPGATPAAGGAQVSGYEYGYFAGATGGAGWNAIEKFQYSTDGAFTDVGDLVTNIGGAQGSASTTYAYTGGSLYFAPPWTLSNMIQKWPFASDENATDVGDLTQNQSTFGQGNQY